MNSADSHQEHTPEFYRQRYLELKARGQDANSLRIAQTLPENPRIIRPGLIISDETIPGGWYWSRRVARGTTLRIINDHATPGVSALFWNANDTSERFNPADTVKVQWTARLGRGKLLFSDLGRCINFFAPLTTDRSGRFMWQGEGLNRGDHVDLRAEMDMLVALSNCPHPLSPDRDWQPRPVRAILWESPMHDSKDFCRRSADEAIRAFENTDAYFGG